MLQLNDDNNLNIRIDSKGVSYELKNDNRLTILRQDIKFPKENEYDQVLLSEMFNKSELQLTGDNVSILYEFGDYQLVPSELYREAYKKELFERYQGKIGNRVLEVKLLPKWGIHFLYALPDVISSFFRNLYPDAEHEHFIFNLLKKETDKTADRMYLNVRDGFIDVVVVTDKDLQLVNSFALKTNDDAVYFVLNIVEQLKLNAETLPVIVFANGHSNDELIELLKKYIENVQIKKLK